MMAVRRMSMLTHAPVDQKLSSRAQQLAKDLNQYMEDSEQVSVSTTPLSLSPPCNTSRALLLPPLTRPTFPIHFVARPVR